MTIIIHKGTQPLVSERLLLNQFQEKDTKDFFKNVTSQPETTKYLSWEYHRTPTITNDMIKKSMEFYSHKNYYNWCIRLKEENYVVIGAIELSFVDDKTLSVGYCLSPKYWHNGYMTEALKLVIQYAKELNCRNIVAECCIENEASIKILKNVGFLLKEVIHYENNQKSLKYILKI